MERALELNPASFATRYNVACGYARTGRADQALDLLEEPAPWKDAPEDLPDPHLALR